MTVTNDNRLILELGNNKKKKLELISLDKMLEVNISRNESKNKIVYSLFSYIMLILLVMIIIKINN